MSRAAGVEPCSLSLGSGRHLLHQCTLGGRLLLYTQKLAEQPNLGNNKKYETVDQMASKNE